MEAVPTTGVSTGGALRMPLDGVPVDTMKGGFYEKRGGGSRGHEAVDLVAPRNTPVRAVEGGTVAKLFNSKAGGLTVYQFDPTGRLVYYYAHLDHYADNLHEGQDVKQGDVIGYVGTTGNAPPGTPHLHFAVFEMNGDKRWWKGEPIDPYPIFRDRVRR
jgi:murein DD-endopeptidase MepM/ murein hydrolase activator NlpD